MSNGCARISTCHSIQSQPAQALTRDHNGDELYEYTYSLYKPTYGNFVFKNDCVYPCCKFETFTVLMAIGCLEICQEYEAM